MAWTQDLSFPAFRAELVPHRMLTALDDTITKIEANFDSVH
jgi:hypothetical protein